MLHNLIAEFLSTGLMILFGGGKLEHGGFRWIFGI